MNLLGKCYQQSKINQNIRGARHVVLWQNISRCNSWQLAGGKSLFIDLRNDGGNKFDRKWNTAENISRTGMLLLFVWWTTTANRFSISSQYFALHHSISWEFTHPRCPSQGFFPSPTVQTLVSLSGNNWSVGWSYLPASLCYVLDVLGLRKEESLSIRKGRRLHNKLRIMWCVSTYNDGHKRGSTSCSVVKTEIHTNCNFKTHIHHCSDVLGFVWSCSFMLPFRLPYNLFVRPYRCPILSAYFNRLVHQDFSHSQSSSGTSTRPYSTTAEPFKCVEYRSIQKGSKRCTVGAVGISCLLCTANCSGNCNGIQWNIFITFRHQGHRGFLNFLQLDVKSFSLLLEDKRSKTSSYADNQANTLLSAELDHPRFKKLIARRQLSELQFWSEIVHVIHKSDFRPKLHETDAFLHPL